MEKKLKCAGCRFAVIDHKASDYTRKYCGKCEKWKDCEVCFGCKKRDDCKASQNQKHKQSCERRCDTVCSQQIINWKAIQCDNPDSEYHKALLNVTPNGDRQDRITWSGCEDSERWCSL